MRSRSEERGLPLGPGEETRRARSISTQSGPWRRLMMLRSSSWNGTPIEVATKQILRAYVAQGGAAVRSAGMVSAVGEIVSVSRRAARRRCWWAWGANLLRRLVPCPSSATEDFKLKQRVAVRARICETYQECADLHHLVLSLNEQLPSKCQWNEIPRKRAV